MAEAKVPHHHYTTVGIKYLLCAPSRPQRRYCFSLTDIRRLEKRFQAYKQTQKNQTLFLTSVHKSVAVRWTLWEHRSQIQPSCNYNPAINDSALLFVLAVTHLVPLHLFICDHFCPRSKFHQAFHLRATLNRIMSWFIPVYIQGSYLAAAAGGLSWQIYAGGWR